MKKLILGVLLALVCLTGSAKPTQTKHTLSHFIEIEVCGVPESIFLTDTHGNVTGIAASNVDKVPGLLPKLKTMTGLVHNINVPGCSSD